VRARRRERAPQGGAAGRRLAVVDLLMPRMSGFEVIERLRSSADCATIPIVVWSGKQLTAAERLALQHSAGCVVAKGERAAEGLLQEIRRKLPIPTAALSLGE
jgi:CheY-like chemotaxis protein